eukprot:2747805-Rhodomonas_salina.4
MVAQVPKRLTVRDPKIDSVFRFCLVRKEERTELWLFFKDVVYPDKKDRIEELQLSDRSNDTLEPRNERVLYLDSWREHAAARHLGNDSSSKCRGRAPMLLQRGGSPMVRVAAQSFQTYSARQVHLFGCLLGRASPSQGRDNPGVQSQATVSEERRRRDCSEWDIREKVTSQVVTNLLSWSIVCLATVQSTARQFTWGEEPGVAPSAEAEGSSTG